MILEANIQIATEIASLIKTHLLKQSLQKMGVKLVTGRNVKQIQLQSQQASVYRYIFIKIN